MKTKWTNQYHRTRNSYPGVGGPLDNNQKARICILAREAYDTLETTFLPFEDWRQMEQQHAIGKDSLRDCVQADYLPLVAHFQNLAGESGRAVKTHLRANMSEKEIALLKLEESLAERGLHRSYAEKICRDQFKCALADANDKQIWNVNFTVRNRRKKRAASPDLIPAAARPSGSDPF